LASPRCYDVVLDPDNSAVVYAGIESVGVIQTTNARWRPGASLEQRMPPFWLTVLPWARASAPINNTIRIGLGAGTPERRTVVTTLGFEAFISHDSGRGWQSVGTHGRWGNLNLDDWAHVAAADPHVRDSFLVGAQNLELLTNDGASTATVAGYGSSAHADQQQVVYDRAQPGVAYLATDGGIWISVDHGATWHDLNFGLITSEIATVGISGTAAVGDLMHNAGLIGTASFPSSTWSFYSGGGELADVHGDPVRPGRFFVFGGKLALKELSIDSVPVIEVVGNTVVSVQWVKAEHSAYYDIGDFVPMAIGFDMRPGSDTIVVGTDQGDLMVTHDGESPKPNWVAVPGMPRNAGIRSIVFPPSSPGRCLALAQDGSIYLKNEIRDAGPWTQVGAASNDARQLAVSSYDENRLYVLHPTALEMSDSSGRTWQTINGTGATSLPPRELKTVFATPTNPSGIIVGTTAGIFTSSNFGSNWQPFDDDLPNCEYKEVFLAGDVLYVTTYGRGIWQQRLPQYFGRTSDFSKNLHFRVSEIVK
jgi:hypothetical protein